MTEHSIVVGDELLKAHSVIQGGHVVDVFCHR